jgi:hypothetical protein
MKNPVLCVALIVLGTTCAPDGCLAQERPKPAGTSNRVVALLTWPFRAYYAETKSTFADLRDDRLLRTEAVVLLGSAAFENVTLQKLYNDNPSSRVNYPARLFVGRRPHGLQLWLVSGVANVAFLDTAHSVSRARNNPRQPDPFMKYTALAGIVGISSWYTVAGVHNLNLKNVAVSRNARTTFQASH